MAKLIITTNVKGSYDHTISITFIDDDGHAGYDYNFNADPNRSKEEREMVAEGFFRRIENWLFSQNCQVMKLPVIILKDFKADYDASIKRDRELATKKEPTKEDIQAKMDETGISFYEAREKLRELAYGGKPPYGFSSWGDYWKSY